MNVKYISLKVLKKRGSKQVISTVVAELEGLPMLVP
jgi:hypothetical protein